MPSTGAVVCLASAVAFGAMGIFGKLAYDEGATVGTLLAVRFLLAAALFWALVVATGAARQVRMLSGRDVGIALALGAVGYAAQAGAYFAALQRLDAGLLSLLLYTFPAMVTVAAIALGRERASRRPRLRNSSTPASRWSCASCCETAEGVNESASATAAIVPRCWSSYSRRRRRRSSIKRCYRMTVTKTNRS